MARNLINNFFEKCSKKFYIFSKISGFFLLGRGIFGGANLFGGSKGGGFRVLACADTGSEDPPWRAPVFILMLIPKDSFVLNFN
jgi:hypothetical protein